MNSNGMMVEAEKMLQKAGVKATSNRLLVAASLLGSSKPVSLIDIETEIGSLERSSVLRVLNLFLKNDIVHAVEDGKGVTKYEICHGEDHCSVNDMHAHFYCENCGETFCFENIGAPLIEVPAGFQTRSVNYMLKGLCPRCHVS